MGNKVSINTVFILTNPEFYHNFMEKIQSTHMFTNL